MLSKKIRLSLIVSSLISPALFILPSAFAQDDSTGGKITTPQTDVAIEAAVKAKINMDPVLKTHRIQVKANRGIVQLKGEVDTDKQAEKLAAIANSLDGVNDVNTSGIKVKNSQSPLKDTYITSKILGKLIRDKIFSDYDVAISQIDVETKDGVVYLTGNARNQTEAQRIEQVAKETEDVKNVVSDLKVK